MLHGCSAGSHEGSLIKSHPKTIDAHDGCFFIHRTVIMTKQGINRHSCTATINGHLFV